VLGYFTLAMAGVPRDELPKKYVCGLAAYDCRWFYWRGWPWTGDSRVADEVGCRGIVTDAWRDGWAGMHVMALWQSGRRGKWPAKDVSRHADGSQCPGRRPPVTLFEKRPKVRCSCATAHNVPLECPLADAVRYSAATLMAAGGYHLTKTIPIPGDYGWDYLTADTDSRRLYVSHDKEVVVMDLDSGAIVGKVPGSDVHGIAVVRELGRGFISATDPGSVTIFDLKTLAGEGR